VTEDDNLEAGKPYASLNSAIASLDIHDTSEKQSLQQQQLGLLRGCSDNTEASSVSSCFRWH
jgi:hypothetical protein